MLSDIASFNFLNNPISSSGYLIDEVAGAQGVKCITHNTELLDVKLRIETRALELRGDTFTLSTVFPGASTFPPRGP